MRLRTFAAALLLAGLLPASASAASFTFSPSAGSYAVGKTFTLKVLLDPKGESVNASDGTLSFDPALLSVTAVSKEGSLFSLWTADPKFSNADGTVEWSGGTPSAFTTSGTIVAITFKAKKAGTATIAATKGSVLAADGKGTDVYAASDSATYTITDAAPEPPPAAEPEPEADAPLAGDVTGSLPIAPQITSSTHGKSEQWYATSTIALAWKPTADVTAMRTAFSQVPDETPTTTQKLASTTAAFSGVSDGTWYFHAQYKNDAGWGPVTHFAINIDTVPPDEFDVALVSGEVPKLSFKATDALSGVERYEVLFGTTTVGSVKEKDFADGLFTIPPTPGGEIAVTVKAADKAGNHRDVTRTLSIPAVAKPTGDEGAPKQSSNLLEHIFLIIFAVATGAISAWYWRFSKQQELERARLLNRVVEVREKNDRVFSAMREELEQMVQDFDEKPQLTPQERDLLEGIKEVLDISEGLLDSALEELKRDVRGK